ncbi:hypothetical protein BC827DRAFT_1384732 [Russula dissimulans]|nr:hypothetical protein BC827DRAFT_1384732 [Russula dissimulans]
MTTYITFHGGNGGAGGGGGGGPVSPSLQVGSGTSTGSGSGQNNNRENSGLVTTDPGQSILPIRRGYLNIDLVRNYSLQTGHITIVPTSQIPKRLLLTTNCVHFGGHSNNTFTYIVDVLLVPVSFNMQTCFQLYHEPFMPSSEISWYMGLTMDTQRSASLVAAAAQFLDGDSVKTAVTARTPKGQDHFSVSVFMRRPSTSSGGAEAGAGAAHASAPVPAPSQTMPDDSGPTTGAAASAAAGINPCSRKLTNNLNKSQIDTVTTGPGSVGGHAALPAKPVCGFQFHATYKLKDDR